MNALLGRALETYTRLDVETGVAAANPQRLVVMLYDGAIKALVAAKSALAQGDVPGRGVSISKAISIVDQGLRPALDMSAGGDIAVNLMALYDYIVNLKEHEASIDEVIHLLGELRGAWEALERSSRPGGGDQPQPQQPDQRAALSYGRV